MKDYQDLIGKIIIAAAIIIAAVISAGNIAASLFRQSKGAPRCALFICTCACYNK